MKPKRRFIVYQEETSAILLRGKWRWRALARNNRIVSSSGENFDSRRNATRAAAQEAALYPEGVAVVEVQA